MILSEYLNKNNIIIGAKSRTRWDLIREILDLAVKNKDVKEEDSDTLKKLLIEREKSMSTGIGKGVAIPHCTSAKVDDITVVFALCENGIDFDSIDNIPVKIVILLIVPKNKLTQHIKTLANIAKIMHQDMLREELLTSKTPESAIKIIKKFENSKK
jgi:fructose-specific phosphotransferase system IIA component